MQTATMQKDDLKKEKKSFWDSQAGILKLKGNSVKLVRRAREILSKQNVDDLIE